MKVESIHILDSNRFQAARLLKNGYCNGLFVQGIREVGVAEFGLDLPHRTSYDSLPYDQLCSLLTKVYEAYDAWKAAQD